MTSNRRRGSALIECAAVTFTLASVVSILLTALYVHYARAWFEYAAEQSLYCLAERRAVATCRTRLRRSVVDQPFVRRTKIKLGRTREHWKVSVQWNIGPFAFGLNKSLTARRILRGADLR